MVFFNPLKLEKLKILAYDKKERDKEPGTGDIFTVMFNPETLSVKYEHEYRKTQGIKTFGQEPVYVHTKSDVVNLQIIVDGTGVTAYPLPPFKQPDSASKQIEKFMTVCYKVKGSIHEPRFLKIDWGDSVLKSFKCRLQSVDIKYTLFDSKGAVLHATLDAVFIQDKPAKQAVAEIKPSSPDLSHKRIVRSGDTLPMLCREIYGSTHHYIRVAQFNNLNNFRDLTPGQTLIFPPLATRKG